MALLRDPHILNSMTLSEKNFLLGVRPTGLNERTFLKTMLSNSKTGQSLTFDISNKEESPTKAPPQISYQRRMIGLSLTK
jgi:hypothetical protein